MLNLYAGLCITRCLDEPCIGAKYLPIFISVTHEAASFLHVYLSQDLFSGSGYFQGRCKNHSAWKKTSPYNQPFSPFLGKAKAAGIGWIGICALFKKLPTPGFSEPFFQIHMSHKLNYSINKVSISVAQWGESYSRKRDRDQIKVQCADK